MYMRKKKTRIIYSAETQSKTQSKMKISHIRDVENQKKSIATAKIKKYFSIKESSCPPGKSGGPIHVFTRNVDFYFHIYIHKYTYIHIK